MGWWLLLNRTVNRLTESRGFNELFMPVAGRVNPETAKVHKEGTNDLTAQDYS